MSQQPMKRYDFIDYPLIKRVLEEREDGRYVLAADVEAMEERSKFLEAENPYASKEWSDLVAASGKAKGDVLAAKLLISQLQHALAAKEAVCAELQARVKELEGKQ